MTKSSDIWVWDAFVRFFHLSLASAFCIAYFTQCDFLVSQLWARYLIFSLLVIRLAWGFIGTRYARFSNFVYSPANIMKFLKDTLRLRAKRYLGHNPAGGAMVILLIFSLLMTTSSGILLLGAEEQAGPVAHWFTQPVGFWGDALEGLHEFFANFTLLLVVVHVFGVLVESLIHKENLVSAMVTGFKPAKNNRIEEKL